MITLYLVEVYAREIITDQFIYDKYGIFSPMVPRTLHLSSLLNFSWNANIINLMYTKTYF